ncbi:HPr kinase/phosphorylase [Brevundimonas sp.]|uniref:HPr kinase/phosphorylase n=1 Tax=Brevundimonas sp. TaxID=1871086 RepID=UPI0025E89527|nr:HPr kinase/phosphatase C-terminal domain-containing protein [Brevundimonas sp.]
MHATAVAGWTRKGWRSVLLRGPSGAGKSDLAFRLMGRGWRLVGDDYVEVWASGNGLFVGPSERIAGLMEVRSLGLVGVRALCPARAVLLVDCATGPLERLPEPQTETLEGVRLPRLALDPFETSAPDKTILALSRALA